MLSRRDFLKLIGGAGGSLLFGQYAKGSPQARRIYLFETHVAGFRYHEGMNPEVAALLVPGTDLVLVREPENKYDEKAVAVFTQQGNQVGYIPGYENEIPATLADQDVFLGAEILNFSKITVLSQCLTVRVFQAIRV